MFSLYFIVSPSDSDVTTVPYKTLNSFSLLVMEYLDISSDFSFLHEKLQGKVDTELQLEDATKSKESAFLVANEVYSLDPGHGVVRQYAAWANQGKLIGKVSREREYLLGKELKQGGSSVGEKD